MEPLHAVERLVPVDIAGLGQRDGGIGTVVDDLARALVRAALKIVNTHTALAGDDALGIHIEAAQLCLAGVRDGVIGQDRQERRVLTVVGKGNGHVGLAAAEGRFEHRGLEEALLFRRSMISPKVRNFIVRSSLTSAAGGRQSRRIPA